MTCSASQNCRMTKSEIQLIKSLADKRARDESGLFVAEGRKLVEELVASGLVVRAVYSVGETISAREMSRISQLRTPTDVLAVVEIPRWGFESEKLRKRLSLALDEVQNPGNVGTIVRLADWFGVTDILCSAGCADVWGPKGVQATMGALTRVRVHYGDLVGMVSAVGEPVYGAFLEGESVYEAALSANGIIVLGSEGRGISAAVERLVSKRLFIPPYPAGRAGSESLNVAVAGAIVCSEFRRRG